MCRYKWVKIVTLIYLQISHHHYHYMHYLPIFQILDIDVELTANHIGYFEFRICPNNDPKKVATQECLDRYLLPLADGSGTKVPVPSNKNRYQIAVKLPEGLTCTQCVLQWHYNTGNI